MWKRILTTLLLILIGLFCIFIPRLLLTEAYLPERYQGMQIVSEAFTCIGVFVVIIALITIKKD